MKHENLVIETLQKHGLIQNNLIGFGQTKISMWTVFFFGAIGGAITQSNAEQYAFTLVDGFLIRIPLKGWGSKEIRVSEAVKFNIADMKKVNFRKVFGGGQLVIAPKGSKKQVYSIIKPIDGMREIINKFAPQNLK